MCVLIFSTTFGVKCVFWFSLQLSGSNVCFDFLYNFWGQMCVLIFSTTFGVKCVLIFSITFGVKCVFWFSLQLLSKTLLVLRRIQQDIIKNVYRSLPLFWSDFNQILIFSIYFHTIVKYEISLKSVQWESSCTMRADGQTDRLNEANSCS